MLKRIQGRNERVERLRSALCAHRGASRTLALWVGMVAMAAGCASTQPIRPSPEPVTLRSLVVMLDGVAWPVMDSLWRAGHFSGFHPPSRLVSTFPSITGVAFRDIWHEPYTAGYEDRYYDRGRSRLAGGLLDHVFAGDEATSFHRHVDVMADGITASLAYIVPVTTARTELTRVRRALTERLSTDTTLVAYIVSTDALAHMSPREDLVAYLLDIETMLDEVRDAAGPDLEITLFSDHGNDRVPTERVDLEAALAAGGFDIARRVQETNDVATPRFGLVGSAFLYTMATSREKVATVISATDGVDFVTWRDSTGVIHVLSGAGRARIEGDDSGYRYHMVSGDPLGLEPVVERLRLSGAADASGFAPDSAWLAETLDGTYIDPLRRITHGLRAVENPADVIASLAPGYHFGGIAADQIVGMAGTHGSLRTSSSLAFVMSSHATVPDPVRTDALATWIELPRAEGGGPGQRPGAKH